MNQPSSHPPTHILWRQVWGLGALVAAILISFVAYGFYQGKILQALGFVDLASWLGIFQGFLGAMLEPLVGGYSDYLLRRFGSRLPMISVGVTIAGLLFVTLALLLLGKLPPIINWLIPVLMTAWVMAMIVFRGPAIALLVQFAPTQSLPQANSVLAIILGLVGAISPLLELLLNKIGTSPTFILGAIALMIGATLFHRFTPKHTLIVPENSLNTSTPKRLLIGLFLVGMGVGLEINLFFSLVPSQLSLSLNSTMPQFITAAMLFISAIIGGLLGEGIIKFKISLKQGMGIGLGAIAVLMGLTLLNHSAIGAILLIIVFGIVLGLIFVEQIPFALVTVTPAQAGLGTGLYFGGMGAALAFASILLKAGDMTLLKGTIWAAIAFGLTEICLLKLMKS